MIFISQNSYNQSNLGNNTYLVYHLFDSHQELQIHESKGAYIAHILQKIFFPKGRNLMHILNYSNILFYRG